jgi:hypothetical protein
MKDCDRRFLEEGRPEVPATQAVDHCLDCLFSDNKRSIHDEVVKGLSFEELIGALLLSRDLAEDAEADPEFSTGEGD